MEVGWRDLLVLLRGDTNVHTICEAIVENLEGNVAALPDICHDVVLGLLSSESPTVRANASQLLMHIAERFSALLQPLISESRNDGDFINIFDIDVGFIAAKEESLLFNRRADASIALDDGSLYKKSWLDRQRRELLKRIKAETASTDFRAATSYTDMDTCIREADVAPSKSGGPGAAVLLPAAPVSLHVSGQDPTEETWLARLVRYLIVGLLSPQWEMRHGCALGLTQLVRGLFPHLEAEQHASAQPPRPQLLPSFLVDDILCCGICVLILDRYMDFGSENAFVLSPVKEAVGELLACALRCDVQPQKVKRVWELLQTMALSKQHWTVPLGGMVALKHFAAANTGLMLGHFGQFLGCLGAALCEDCAGREELVLAACEVIRAFAVPVRADLLGQVVLVQVLDGLSMLADMLISVVALVASDDRHWSPRSVQGLAAALSSVGALVLAMAAASASVSASEPVSAVCERALQCCSLVLRGFCALLAVGPRYRPATKLTCCELLGAALGAAFETASAHAPGQASLIATCSTSTVDEFSSTLFSLLGTLLATCVLSTDRPVSDLTLTMEAPPAKGKAAVAVAERGAASFCATWDPPVELFTSQQLWTRVARAFRRTSLLSFACSSCAPGGEVDVQHQLLLASVLQRVVTSGTDPDSEPPHGQTQAWVEGLLGRVSSPMSALRNAAFAGHVVAMEQHCVHLHDVARLSPLSPVDPAKSAEPAEKGKASNSIWMNYRPQGLDPLRFIVSELLRADAPDCDVSLLPPRGDGGASPHTEICSAFAEGLGAVADEFARRLQACDEQLLRKEKRRRDKGAPLAKRSRFSFVLVPDVCEEPQHQDAPESMHPIPPLAQGGMSEAKRRLQEQRDMLAGAVEGALLLAAEVANASLTHSARGALRDCARNACTPTHPANARMHFAAYYLQSALDRQVGDALSLARSPGIDLCLHPTHIARSLAHLFLEGEEGGSLWAVLLELCSVGGRGGFAVAQSTVYLLVKVLQQEFLQRFPAFFPALTLDMRARDRGTLGSTMSDSPAALLLHCALCGANAALLRRLVVEQGIVAAVVDAVGAGEMPADPARQLRGASIAAASCARLFAPCGRAGEGAGEAAGEGAGAGAGEGVASAFQYLVAQQIAERLHGVITQAPVAHPYLQDEDGGSAREGAAELLRLLAIHTRGVVLCCYELWFVSALHGVGDPSGAVRGACVHVFRLLVPLAGLAQQTRQRRTALTQREQGQGQESGVAPPSAADLVEQVFTQQPLPRISQSASPQDAQIMAQLARLTNLVEKGDGGQVEGLAGSQLRGYQWDGVSWLTHLRRLGLCGVLADEMGLGKTLQALTTLAVLRIESNFTTRPSLIVCPAALVFHWESEIGRHFPALLMTAKRAGKPQKAPPALSPSDVLIVSYDRLRGDASLQKISWAMLILDEAHVIRNPATLTAQRVFSLRSQSRLALTGTPVQNHVEEVWSLMNFLLPDYLGDFPTFRSAVVRPIQRSLLVQAEVASGVPGQSDKLKFGRSIAISAEGLGVLRRLHKQILPFILRRTKAVVAAELPSKTVVDVLCPLSAPQLQLYAAYQRSLRTSDDLMEQQLRCLKDGQGPAEGPEEDTPAEAGDGFALDGWSAGAGLRAFDDEPAQRAKPHPFQMLHYLKQLCVHPCLVTTHGSYRERLLRSASSSGKLLRLAHLLLASGVVSKSELHACAENVQALLELDNPGERQVDNNGEGDDANPEGEGDDEGSEKSEAGVERDGEGGKSPVKKLEGGEESAGGEGTGPKRSDPVIDLTAEHLFSSMANAFASPQHRCLVFAQHRATLDLVQSQVLKPFFPHVRYERLDGSVPPQQRAAVVQRFNEQPPLTRHADSSVGFRAQGVQTHASIESLKHALPTAHRQEACACGPDVRLLLLTTRSCGLGLNLVGADTVIFLEHDWNPFADLQAMDRAHRIGQTQPVTVYRLLAESTIEARIIGLQGLKEEIAAHVISGDRTQGLNAGGDSNNMGRALMDSVSLQFH